MANVGFHPPTAQNTLFQCGECQPTNELLQGPLGLIRHFRAKHAHDASHPPCPRAHCLFADEDPGSIKRHCQSHEYYDTRAEHDSEGQLLATCDTCEVSEVSHEQHRTLEWHKEMSFYSRILPAPRILPLQETRTSNSEEFPASNPSRSEIQQYLNDRAHEERAPKKAIGSTIPSHLQRTDTASHETSLLQLPSKLQFPRSEPVKAGDVERSLGLSREEKQEQGFKSLPQFRQTVPRAEWRSKATPVGETAQHERIGQLLQKRSASPIEQDMEQRRKTSLGTMHAPIDLTDDG